MHDLPVEVGQPEVNDALEVSRGQSAKRGRFGSETGPKNCLANGAEAGSHHVEVSECSDDGTRCTETGEPSIRWGAEGGDRPRISHSAVRVCTASRTVMDLPVIRQASSVLIGPFDPSPDQRHDGDDFAPTGGEGHHRITVVGHRLRIRSGLEQQFHGMGDAPRQWFGVT